MNNEEWVTGTIKLSLNGEPIEMEMTVPAKAIKPTRMLPIFQQMTSSFVDLGVSKVKAQGKEISCRAGCGACCRQAVPLAEIEAYQIAELVENMPEPRRSEIKRRFAEGVRHFHENQWLEKMDGYAELSNEDREKLILEYFYQGIPCPFLEDESCSIHPDRPLACREYLVTSPAENCAKPTAQTIRMIKPLLEFSKTLRRLGRTGNLVALNFIPMIRALEWAENFPESFEEKTGNEWMTNYFRDLLGTEIPSDKAKPETH